MPDVVIVGGGLAGLACAARLREARIEFQLLEATERVGGRVRTDRIDRFQLDHGFQFLACDDPAPQLLLDFDRLRLRAFDRQLWVWRGDQFEALSGDAELSGAARSDAIERMLRSIARGQAALPAEGMGAIPRQLAERLSGGSLVLQRTVVECDAGGVRMSDGEWLPARVLVLATESTAADRLTTPWRAADRERFDSPWERAECLYFAADFGTAPPPAAMHRGLLLRGDAAEGPVEHVAVLSNVAAEYAPPGQPLVSVSLDAEASCGGVAIDVVRDQLRGWFGRSVDRWKHLRNYAIPYAYPARDAAAAGPDRRTVEPFGEEGPIVCGDHRETASIQGALNSGLQAAEAVVRRMG